MSLQALLSALVLVIDIFFVAMLGEDAVNAVGLIAGLTAMMGIVVNGAGIAATTLVANAWAADRTTERADALLQTIASLVTLSVILPVIGIAVYRPYMEFMAATAELTMLGRGYALCVILGFPAVVALYMLNCVMRGAGKPEYALHALIITCVLSIVLNPILIYGRGPLPAMGLAGAGMASVAGRAAGCLYLFWRLLRADRMTFPPVSLQRLMPALRSMGRLVSLTTSGTAQTLVAIATSLFVLRFLAALDPAVLAGYVVGNRIVGLVALPITGVATACCVLVGQNSAEGRRWFAIAGLWTAIAIGAALAILVAIILVALPGPMLAFFELSKDAQNEATTYLFYTAIFMLPFAIGGIANYAANGLGLMREVAFLQLAALVAVQIPATFLLASAIGTDSVWIALGACYLIWAAGGLWLVLRHLRYRQRPETEAV